MTERELREIKRRFRPERSNVPRIVGCFVNGNGEIVYRISQSLGLGEETVSEKLLGVMKKAVSGSLGTNLTELAFTVKEVEESREHKLLMKLRNSRLEDKEALEEFYRRAIQGVKIEGNYVILLASDVYDVPTKSRDGLSEDSYTQFSYMVCAVCPLKTPPEVLAFREADTLFHYADSTAHLSSPELGFMFPAFDDRCTNIYGALFYSRSMTASHSEFVESVFKKTAPTPPVEQKASFAGCLVEALKEECTLDVIRSVNAQVEEMLELKKEERDPEPLLITKPLVKTMLENCGISEATVEKFGDAMDESFGKNAAIAPKNVLSAKRMEIKTPEISIKVAAEHKHLVSTRVINGKKYIMVEVPTTAELNGIHIEIAE